MIVLFIFIPACESLSFNNIFTFNVTTDKLRFHYIICFPFVLVLIYIFSFPHFPLSYINIVTTHFGLSLVAYLHCVFIYIPFGLRSLGIYSYISVYNLPPSTGASIYQVESSIDILFLCPLNLV